MVYNLILAGVTDGVVPHSVVHVDGGGEVSVVLGDYCGRWWERC